MSWKDTTSRRPKRRSDAACGGRRLRSLFGAGLGLLVLAGCGSGEPSDDYRAFQPDEVARKDVNDDGETGNESGADQTAANDSAVETNGTSSTETETEGASSPGDARPADDPAEQTVAASDTEPPSDTGENGEPTSDDSTRAAADDDPRDPAGANEGKGPKTTAAEPVDPSYEVLVEEPTFEAVGPNGALRVSYEDLDLQRIIGMDPVRPDAPKFMPDWLRDLENQRVRLRGMMVPSEFLKGLKFFILARDAQACCFGPNQKVYHLVSVKLREGTTTNYVDRQFIEVTGEFHIKPVEIGGDLVQLYRLEDAVVVKR